MSATKSVRPSREGDQFHYVWAARRCLRLLAPTSDLTAVAIEGTSPEDPTEADEVIDVAEYYGSSDPDKASSIKYFQLKHSTLRATEEWTFSGLRGTLKGFGKKYIEHLKSSSQELLAKKLEFHFVTNRPIGAELLDTIHDAAIGSTFRRPKGGEKLTNATGLSGSDLTAFAGLLRIEGKTPDFWHQRGGLAIDTGAYLPGTDQEAPILLKELVQRKALPESADNPTIVKLDVLHALGIPSEERLFPARCLIAPPAHVVPREQERKLSEAIVSAAQRPVVIQAAGGVGKSVLATRIAQHLPDRSVCILYDCFGNGGYRNPTQYRHRPKDALVQISNELASQSLCDTLLPSDKADATDYLRAFVHRLTQSVRAVKQRNEQALICIVIDAADNAEISARQAGEGRSFVRGLLRESPPDGVRVVALCRPERKDKLEPPPEALQLELGSFTRAETAAHLRQSFPFANEHEVDEFHALSSQNPRVQSLALSRGESLSKVLSSLGPGPTSVEDTIRQLLEKSVAELRDIERDQTDRICIGFATLRPPIPISVLAAAAEVSPSAIESLASDLSHPLLVADGAVQFRDEPTETWFRERFASKADLHRFVGTLKPLAASSAYVASSLPQLMLEAGLLPELIAMALDSTGLPDNPIERRDVELQRLQFALKASLREKRYANAVKLALKAGGETAGHSRQESLLEANLDLASAFLEADRVRDLVARSTFGGDWLGSHFAHSACLMSGVPGLKGEASGRLRSSEEWLDHWTRLPEEEREKNAVGDADRLALATAHLNVHGPHDCAHFLRRWRPREISFRIGRLLAARLVDAGRFEELERLAVDAKNDIGLVLAIALELHDVDRIPPPEATSRALRILGDPPVNVSHWESNDERLVLGAVAALVEAGSRQSCLDPPALAALLTRYLPTDLKTLHFPAYWDSGRSNLLFAYSLRSELLGENMGWIDLAHPELRKKCEDPNSGYSEEVQRFKGIVGRLLPWHSLRAKVRAGKLQRVSLENRIRQADSDSRSATTYGQSEPLIDNEIARVWIDILIASGSLKPPYLEEFENWVESLRRPLFTITRTHLARIASRATGASSKAMDWAVSTYKDILRQREDAEEQAKDLIQLARAVWTISNPDSQEYFNTAVEILGKIGDENLNRWEAVLDLADRAAEKGKPLPQTAYELSRCAELTCSYTREKYFDFEATISALVGLDAPSAIAILSRWRDRQFGPSNVLLRLAVHSTVEDGSLDPSTALCLIGFGSARGYAEILERVLDAGTSERQAAADVFCRYMALEHQDDDKTLLSMRDLLSCHHLETSNLERILEGFKEAPKTTRGATWEPPSSEIAWDSIFRDVDISSIDGISKAFRALRAEKHYVNRRTLFREACSRITLGREKEFIDALKGVQELTVSDLLEFLEGVPQSWRDRPAVTKDIQTAVKDLSRRFRQDITAPSRNQLVSLKRLAELSGLSEEAIIDVVLSALAEDAEHMGSRRLFTLVGLVATRLSGNEARDALSFGLGLYDEILNDSDGDGPWNESLAPPIGIEASVAGYIWAALGSPRAGIRWEGAHVVRALCRMGRSQVLEALITRARTQRGGPFVDATLAFYDLHARQWLMIAFARAAQESPHALQPHLDFLLEAAGGTHVLIRHFAAEAVLNLSSAGVVSLPHEIEQRLRTMNESPSPPIEDEPRRKKWLELAPDENMSDFYFDMDMDQYWFQPLGECFGASGPSVSRLVRQVIRLDLKHDGLNRWDGDERQCRRLIESPARLQSPQRVDDLPFYRSYHALMIAAGKLLAEYPTVRNSWGGGFPEWIAKHKLTRPDGRWLFDLREPQPPETRMPDYDGERVNWPWSIARGDFDRHLRPRSGLIAVRAHWTARGSYGGEETVSIDSALVSPRHSDALIRALQTANPYDCAIPDPGDGEIDYRGFRLKGWIDHRDCAARLDEYDPWAAEVQFPPFAPVEGVVELMGIQSDPEGCVWSAADPERIVLQCQNWSQERTGSRTPEYDTGTRLLASLEFIIDLLKKEKMDMVIKVKIHRTNDHHYAGVNDEEYGLRDPSARLFLIKRDGVIYSL